MRPCLWIAAAAVALLGCGAEPPAPEVRPAEPDGRLVLAVLGPERIVVADPRSGWTRARQVPGGTLCHGPVITARGRVVYAGARSGRLVALSLPIDLRGQARSLGRADATVAAGGRAWLGRRRPHGAIAVREVDGDGRIRARLPRWASVAGVVDGTLLVRDDDGLRLVGRTFVRGGWPLAATGTRFAWCRGDDLCRAAGVWSADGAQALEPPAGVRVRLGGQAAFSPDGRRLALPVRAGGRDRVAIVALASGRWEVAGARLTGYRAVAWSPSGRWIYFTGRRDRLFAWAPGAAARPLPVRTGGRVMSIASG